MLACSYWEVRLCFVQASCQEMNTVLAVAWLTWMCTRLHALLCMYCVYSMLWMHQRNKGLLQVNTSTVQSSLLQWRRRQTQTNTFWQWLCLRIGVVCFVGGSVQRQVQDTCHILQKGHDASASFRTTADGRVATSVTHCSTLASAPMLRCYSVLYTWAYYMSIVRCWRCLSVSAVLLLYGSASLHRLLGTDF